MARQKNTCAASGAGSIRQRPDGRWEGRITVGTNPATGKPIRRSIYGDTQAAVRKEMTAILRELDKGTYTAPSKMKVSDWLSQWMETFCANKVKPFTYSSYDTIIRKHINPAIGRMELQAVKARTIEPPPIAFQYLKAERSRQLENRFKAMGAWDNPDDLVFTDETGKHLAIISFYRHFKRIAASIGRPDARPHDLRHPYVKTATSYYLQNFAEIFCTVSICASP